MEFLNEADYLFFSTLASHTRLAMLDVLRAGSKGLDEISDYMGIEKDLVAKNLDRLSNVALIVSVGVGGEERYTVNREIIEPLSEFLTFHLNKYCPNLTECILPEKLKEYMKKEADKTIYIDHK